MVVMVKSNGCIRDNDWSWQRNSSEIAVDGCAASPGRFVLLPVIIPACVAVGQRVSIATGHQVRSREYNQWNFL